MITPNIISMLQDASATEEDLRRSACELIHMPESSSARRFIGQALKAGHDPLGDLFCTLRDAKTRRDDGAVYTPSKIVDAMIGWAAAATSPDRIVDAGCGSGRFLVAAGKVFPHAELVGFDTDPLACHISRANLEIMGFGSRTSVRQEDFLRADVARIDGQTLWIGNPPYVRHHQITSRDKDWLKIHARLLDLPSSGLAGLHVYFLLAIALKAKLGDYGAQITSAEWLDVNYGKLVRELFTKQLGGRSVLTLEATAQPFPGTATTGAITTFQFGHTVNTPTFSRIKTVNELGPLESGTPILRDRLLTEARWSHFTRSRRSIPRDHIELGELCRVHRGQVTGANAVWIEGEHTRGLPEHVFYPTVTKARDLINAGVRLQDVDALRRVVDLPRDLSELSDGDRVAVERFLRRRAVFAAKEGYVAQNRRAWWSVDLRAPAPILATYMARRPPSFVLNDVGARHINIAHGLYPRETLTQDILEALAAHLRATATTDGGRIYAGGLTKFEPREMERLPIPRPEVLAQFVKEKAPILEVKQ
jgi:SAM-dependent methyltransferase